MSTAPQMPQWAPHGALAQLVEHLLCKQGVRGSSPLCSTPSAVVRAIWQPDRRQSDTLLTPFDSNAPHHTQAVGGWLTGSLHSDQGVDDDLIAAAGRLESQALDLERVASELRRQAADLRAAKPAKPLPALISIKEAVERSGLSEWAVRKLLEDGVLHEVRVGDRRLIQTSSLIDLAGAA